MNAFQKVGVFVIRVVGSVGIAIGSLGLAYVGMVATQILPPSPRASLVSSLMWVGEGILICVVARPVGKFLGQGLG
jgi:hypothetical protein